MSDVGFGQAIDLEFDLFNGVFRLVPIARWTCRSDHQGVELVLMALPLDQLATIK